ncbi:glycosyltransferase [Rhodobacteraceae bacterium]|nr:glycosyltransferase [Paracoccaceae bacterium]
MDETYFLMAFLGLVLSFVGALTLAGLFKYFGRQDLNIQKKRAAHSRPTSRLGGLAVCLSVMIVILIHKGPWHLEIAISAFPIFAVGLMEDLGWPLKPKIRLAVGALSASIFVFFKRHYINDVDFEWVNLVLSVTPIALAFTVFCVVGLINALNFIDGVNGLASGKTLIASLALVWLSSHLQRA